jgi:hypothetical protein
MGFYLKIINGILDVQKHHFFDLHPLIVHLKISYGKNPNGMFLGI